MNKANEIRPLLDGLRTVARDTDCAVLFIEHLNKQTTQTALYRGSGSADFTNAARSVLLVNFHPTDATLRVCAQIKANAKYGSPIAFNIDQTDGTFSWRGTCEVDINELASAKRTGKAQTEAQPVEMQIAQIIGRFYPNGWKGNATNLIDFVKPHIQGSALLPSAAAMSRQLQKFVPEMAKLGIGYACRKGELRFEPLDRKLYDTSISSESSISSISSDP